MSVKECALTLLTMTFLAFSSIARGQLTKPTSGEKSTITPAPIRSIEMEQQVEEIQFELKALKRAKWAMMNGRIETAEKELRKINSYTSDLALVRDYYYSLLEFVRGNYQKALKRTTGKEFQKLESFRQSCLLTSLLRMIEHPPLKQSNDQRNRQLIEKHRTKLKSNIEKCQDFTEDYSTNDQYWYENLQKMSFGEESLLRGDELSDINYILSRPEMVRIWLKTGIYTNNPSLIQPHLESLPPDIYQRPRFRELMGMYFYRTGNIERTKDFIENLDTANAHNIRGNIELKNEKFELAFGHFQLALEEKINSQNALERAIPLSWTLEQWKKGQNMLNMMISKKYDPIQKRSLNAAFSIQRGHLEYADRELKAIESYYENQTPFLVNLMTSYVALRQHNNQRFARFAEKSCKKEDGTSCWLLQESLIWSDFSQTIEREGEIWDKKINIEELKKWRDFEPLKEEVYVDQSDIRELDTREVNLPFQSFRLLKETDSER